MRFNALHTQRGRAALNAAAALSPSIETFLTHLKPLSKEYGGELARAALETAILRARARAKFSRADRMYFTREALEQASAEIVSAYRARRYSNHVRVADLGCGIGGDTLGLAGVVEVAAVDNDPLRLAMAAENVAVYGVQAQVTFMEADLLAGALPDAGAVWFDPGRRAAGRRIYSVHDYLPPLDVIAGWLPRVPDVGVKLSPGVRLAEIEHYDAEIEFISVNGELREAVLWLGGLQHGTRRATLLPGGHTLLPVDGAPVPVGPPRAVLYEPDPAVLRAGLVEDLARVLGAGKIDPDIAYLTSDAVAPTPFARAFFVEQDMPFGIKRVRAALRALGVGRVTVKKRGSPLEVDAFVRAMKLRGDPANEKIVFLTHVQQRPWVLIARPVL